MENSYSSIHKTIFWNMDKKEKQNETISAGHFPSFQLTSGHKIPSIGLGTFGSDYAAPSQVAEMVRNGIIAGYRHIDCASVYGNEIEIGQVLSNLINEGIVNREELWITSKVWNDMHGEGRVIESCKKTLSDLKLDYLELYLIHWPFPNYHPPMCDVTLRNKDSKPYIHENYMIAWRQMEKLYNDGLINNIGTSNMTIPKLKLLLRDARIMPVVNQIELHPHFQQQELFDFCRENDIQPVGYSPVGSPGRPDRDRTSSDTVDLEDPVIINIAKRLNVTPAYVAIRWAIQRGQVPIPFSLNHYKNNLEAAVGVSLSDEDMKAVSTLDKNCRLIKGHVFLWKENQSWEDLWDVDGIITPA